MRIIGVTFALATDPSSPFRLTTKRGAGAPLSAGVSAIQPSRHFVPFIEMMVFTILLAALPLATPARAQLITITPLTATPAPVQPGKPLVLAAKITANQNLSNYPVL